MQKSEQFQIYDAHSHIFPEKIARKASEAIGGFYNLAMKYSGDSNELIKSGQQIGVKKYLVCSTATVPAQTAPINDFIIGECKSHPEFIGFGALHPDTPDIDLEIEKIIKGGLKGIKIHPDFQKFNIDDKEAFEIYDRIQGKLPVLVHMGDDRYDYSRPFRLKNVMDKFPQLVVIAAHFGGYQRWEEAVDCLIGNDNIYFDTCSTLGVVSNDYAKKLVGKFDKERLMFGTDFPMWDHKEELERFLALELSYEDNKKILGGNFRRIFNV